MLTLHHLDDSRSQRILWLLEELGLSYEVVLHLRDPATRLAGPELKAVHPLGKAPVLVDGDITVAESGAIVDRLIRQHGGGSMQPEPGTAAHERYLEWLHFAEGSAMTPFLLKLYMGRLGEAAAPLAPRIDGEIANTLAYLEASLEGRDWLIGGAEPTGADVMMSFVGEISAKLAAPDRYPAIAAWVARIHARPAWGRALERGGAPYSYG